jgi:HAD superfamily hydrolase (TIGR01549 family)
MASQWSLPGDSFAHLLHTTRTMPAIRFVYFDLDDTLLDHRWAEQQALAALYTLFAGHWGAWTLAQVQQTYHAHNVAVWQAYSAGTISKAQTRWLRFARTLEALEITTLDPHHLGEVYLDRYGEHWHFPPAARQAFHAIADHYPVGVLTNGFREQQRAKLERFPDLRDRLAVTVISEEVGAMKPHPALFAWATRAADVPPETILYVGDSYHADVQGARAAGWQSAWYTADGATAPPDVLCFDDWDKLCQVLIPKQER